MARWLCGVSELEALAVVVSVFLVCAFVCVNFIFKIFILKFKQRLHIHGERPLRVAPHTKPTSSTSRSDATERKSSPTTRPTCLKSPICRRGTP
jgi:hypothetical protein